MNPKPPTSRVRRPRTQPVGRDQIVAAVLDAAGDLFAKTPVDQVTTRMLASHAKVNLGLIHRHLGTKEEVLHALMERYATTFRNEVAQASDPVASFQLLLNDPVQGAFVRTLAFVMLSGADLDVVMSRAGAIKEMVKLAKAQPAAQDRARRSNDGEEVKIESKIVVGWSLILGWLLFKPFLLRAAGAPAGASDVERLISELLSGLFGEADKPKTLPRKIRQLPSRA